MKTSRRAPCLIRPAAVPDAEAMTRLLNPIIERADLTAITEPATVDSQRAFIHAFPDPGVFLVAVDPDSRQLLGMQDVLPISRPGIDDDDTTWIGDISTFIDPRAWRRGIGRALTDATVPAAARAGARQLRAVIRQSNPDASAFYQSMGFIPPTDEPHGHDNHETMVLIRDLIR